MMGYGAYVLAAKAAVDSSRIVVSVWYLLSAAPSSWYHRNFDFFSAQLGDFFLHIGTQYIYANTQIKFKTAYISVNARGGFAYMPTQVRTGTVTGSDDESCSIRHWTDVLPFYAFSQKKKSREMPTL